MAYNLGYDGMDGSAMTRRTRRDALYDWLREYVAHQMEAAGDQPDVIGPMTIVQVPYRGPTQPPSGIYVQWGTAARVVVPIGLPDWEAWGRDVVTEWCAVSLVGVNATIEGEPVTPAVLAHESYRLDGIGEDDGLRVFLKPGGPPLVYFADGCGVETVEYLSPVAGGTAYVEAAEGTTASLRASVRHQLTERRLTVPDRDTGWGTTYQDSQSRYGRLLLDEIRRGVHAPVLDRFATLLRQVLPGLRVGTPSVADVRSKLEMESKLRRSEGVTGSLRPLAFTLEALQGVPEDVPDERYPGLWLLTTEQTTDVDLRTWFRLLLCWDSVCAVLAAACRFHGECKPGLCFGRETSRTVYVPERRYSKRDSGAVESAYLQVNPSRVVGGTDAAALRLIQAATHELAHLGTYSNVAHTEHFTTRRETLLMLAADQVPVVRELVLAAELGEERYKAGVERPLSIEQFLAEELQHPAGAAVEFLVNRWAAVRNISVSKADQEVLAELERQATLGRVAVVETEGLALPL